ncbi:CHAD domain-containing protein [Nocardioides coralli]|uniref:CHAD domain-containing protein n=1 Tax=Nocardioides coralli TaxID=2872154 RepID=UPI001CA3BA03|nr:CHAD domain-containing protein [Nocardioides coralli]QZY29289.1 CHAD domain-containing protein [Nocardioides coralli]
MAGEIETAVAPARVRPPRRDRAASRVVHVRIIEQVAELGRRDGEVRRGSPEGLHEMRVACRRLRGVLATYRPLVDRSVTEPLRGELRWLARGLGEARDLDVVHDRLRGLVDEEPEELVLGPVRRRIDRHFAERHEDAHARVREVLDSPRYRSLRIGLDQLADAPPWTEVATRDARDVLPARLAKELQRVRRRVDRASSTDDPVEHDAGIHAARRATKRLRYAAEALEPAWGSEASRLVGAATRMTSRLGTRQDSVVARTELLTLARAAAEEGENAFTYGVLHAEETRRARRVDAEVEELLSHVELAAERLV